MSSSNPIPLLFEFENTELRATGTRADSVHDNVLRITLQLDHPLLPHTIILKKRKPGWEDEFETEKETYHRLKELQGHYIPKLYGEVDCAGTPGLLLSDVGGTPLYKLYEPELKKAYLKKLLDTAVRHLLRFGVEHDDLKLEHFHLVRGVPDRIVIIDFERVDPLRSENIEPIQDEIVSLVLEKYVNNQKNRDLCAALGILYK